MEGLLLIFHYLVSLYASTVFLRFIAQWLGADFQNPISQAIVQITNPPLLLLRRIVPSWKNKDISALVLLMLVITSEALILDLLYDTQNPTVILFAILFRCFSIILNTYFFMLLISTFTSWINQDPYNPIQHFFSTMLAPLLRPIQKHINPLGGILDITPMILLMLIYFLQYQSKIWFLNILQNFIDLNNLESSLMQFLQWMLT